MRHQRRCLKTLNTLKQDDGVILLNMLFLAALIKSNKATRT